MYFISNPYGKTDTVNTASSRRHNIIERKKRHLDICLDPKAQIEGSDTGFDEVSFINNPLPECDYRTIRLDSVFLGKPVSSPFFISSMTGGSEKGFRINKDLVRAAQALGIPVGLGSLRVLFSHPELREHFALKNLGPDIPIFGNLGAVQVREMPVVPIIELLTSLDLDAVAVHLNPGQELAQEDGDRDFSGLLSSIEKLARRFPVIVKETGFGIPPCTVRRLLDAGVSCIDIAGAGGTNWVRIEEQRSGNRGKKTGTFDNWGIPTAVNLAALSKAPFSGKIFASGGLRTPLDFAKALALGAIGAGTALPLLQVHKNRGVKGIIGYWQSLFCEVKKIMLMTGASTPEELSQVPLILSSGFRDYVRQLSDGNDWRASVLV